MTPAYDVIPQQLSDLFLVFSGASELHNKESLHAAILSEYGDSSSRTLIMLGCTSYKGAEEMQKYLSIYHNHPVYYGFRQNRVCHVFQVFGIPTIVIKELKCEGVEFTVVPHSLKFDNNIEHFASENFSEKQFVLEIGLGLGVQSKGLGYDHMTVGHEILETATRILSDSTLRSDHLEAFYWTGAEAQRIVRPEGAEKLHARRELIERADSSSCSYLDIHPSKLELHASKSHLIITNTDRRSLPVQCMAFLASVATRHPHVSHVQAHAGYHSLGTSIPYDEPGSMNATDQNAWIQSGTSYEKPYSDMGLAGEGYIFSIIDTGLDDLSCFLIDSTGERTTRTPKGKAPINEFFRRKVIHYIAYADEYPDWEYDHGTWCAGSAAGECIHIKHNDPKHEADAYNGIAHKAKIAIYDVENRETNRMHVPSMYHYTLPAAYDSGARVSSNSWGTPGLTSYTSVALEVDEFMYENKDFLVVVAAGNAGDTGIDSVMSPGISKNALTIGASAANHDNIVDFSGIGKQFDGRIKPDVIGPGTDLFSAGVGNVDDERSCNKQISSGTSMATPIIAGASILVREYFEQPNNWASVCNKNYHSCPSPAAAANTSPYHRELKRAKKLKDKNHKSSGRDDIVEPPTGFISGALLKGVLVHSAMDMKLLLSEWNSILPTVNLTTSVPPDRFQVLLIICICGLCVVTYTKGMGSSHTDNVLPIPGDAKFDLYVADYQEIRPMTETTYFAHVHSAKHAFRATLAWVDPPNVMWTVKNLLHDLDLIVRSPSGKVFYGNHRRGDEFNVLERVVIDAPEKGEYSVSVMAKKFGAAEVQPYSLIITSDGYVHEDRTATRNITALDINYDDDTMRCAAAGGMLVRYQMEDFQAGMSWMGVYFTISKVDLHGRRGELVYTSTFDSNHDNSIAVTNRLLQRSVCVQEGVDFIAEINTNSAGDIYHSAQFLRVVIPECKVFLSDFQKSARLRVDNGVCGKCPVDATSVAVVMESFVLNDDLKEFSWSGEAHYSIYRGLEVDEKNRVAAGTLMVSDEQADSYCLTNGDYVVALEDHTLFRESGQHAKVVFEAQGQAPITLLGTQNQYFRVGLGPNKPQEHALAYSMGGVVALAAVVLLLIMKWCSRKDNMTPTIRASSRETAPLLSSSPGK